MKKENAYHIKFKLIPKKIGFKPNFIQGIVFDTSQELAVKNVTEKIIEAVNTNAYETEVEVKIQSVVKLRKDFLLFPDKIIKSDDSN